MIGERVNSVRVRTPEGIVFAFPLAGPVARFLACVIDGAVVGATMSLLGFVLILLGLVSRDLAIAVHLALWFFISTTYGMVFEWRWRGQTVGKKVLRLRVVDAGGLPLTVFQVVLRNLLRSVDQFPAFYLLGGAVMMLSPRAQRLGDIAAGTIVVRHRRTPEPDVAQLFAGKFNSLREYPHLAARLRQQVPPALAAAAVEALIRRDALEPDARVALFGELAAALRRLVPFPPETTAGMPDEAYVRNVVEIVHAADSGGEAQAAGGARPAFSA